MSILDQLFSELSSREVILSTVFFILGWTVAYYYHHELRQENRELKVNIENFRTELLGQTTDSVKRKLEDFEIVPDILLDRVQTSLREPIQSYNEEIRYVSGELEKQLHALVGDEFWPQFRSSFEIIVDHQRGKQLMVRDCLLGLEMYGSMLGPQDEWYDALCTALYRCKKFEKIGEPPKPSLFLPPRRRELVYFRHGHVISCPLEEIPVARIKRQDQEDLLLVVGGEVMRFAEQVYQQLSQTRFSELDRIDDLKKSVEASLG